MTTAFDLMPLSIAYTDKNDIRIYTAVQLKVYLIACVLRVCPKR